MDKKGTISTMQMVAFTVLILLVLIVSLNIYGNSTRTFTSAINPMGDDGLVDVCQAAADEKEDVDGDGLYDECDYCVLKVENTGQKQEIRDIYAEAGINIDQVSSFNPGYREGQNVAELNKKYDSDGDGIVGVCDYKKGEAWFTGNKIEHSCKKIHDKLEDVNNIEVDYKASAHNGAYSRCVIEYVE